MKTLSSTAIVLCISICIFPVQSVISQDEATRGVQIIQPPPLTNDQIDRAELIGDLAASAKLFVINFDEIKELGKEDNERDFFITIKGVGELKLDVAKRTGGDNDIAWYGSLVGDVGGQFVLNYLERFPMEEDGEVLRSVALAGSFYLDNGDVYYLWPYRNEGLHSLRKWNSLRLGADCDCVHPGDDGEAAPARNAGLKRKKKKRLKKSNTVSADEDHVNVLFVYTAEAASILSPTSIEAMAGSYITQLNLAFANSDIDHTVTKVDIQATDYIEALKISDILKDLRLGNEQLSDVADWRSDSEADVVCLIVKKRGGIAYRMTYGLNDADDFKERAYLVVNVENSMDGEIRFCHEFGHLFGGCHEQCKLNQSGNGEPLLHHVYPHGYDFVTGGPDVHKKWVTVMGSSTRIQGRRRSLRFSNPDKLDHNGAESVPTGSATSNNAETIRTTIPTIKALLPDSE